jgi:putative membrane protein
MTAVVLAQMLGDRGDDHMGSGWWWLMGIGWLAFLAALIVLIVVVARHLSQPRPPALQSARDVLAERFARGELDEDEYRARRDALDR